MDIRKITRRAAQQPDRPFLPDAARTRIKDERPSAAAQRHPHLDRRMVERHDASTLPPGAPSMADREVSADEA
jgi:hypothetical protein